MKKRLTLILLGILITVLPIAHATDYASHWAKQAIEHAIKTGLMTGTEKDTFEPDRAITRAEFVTMIMRDLELPSESSASVFYDVNKTDWFYKSVCTAEKYEIIQGTDDRLFLPFDNITRQDAVTMLGRAYKLPLDIPFNITQFGDGVEIADYAVGYMGYMTTANIMTGYEDKTIRPLKTISRAEAVTILNRLKKQDYTNHTPSPVLPQENETIHFSKGYPKLLDTGVINGFNLLIQTDAPATIYYKLVDTAAAGSSLVPARSAITDVLTVIPAADTEQSCYIPADVRKQYNIFLYAKTDTGAFSKVAWITNAAPLSYAQGDGTPGNPYLVYSQQQLKAIASYPSKHYKLENDITLADNWTPICSAETEQTKFSGTLDGNGHKISNLNIDSAKNYTGLFASISTGTVKNLYIEAKTVKGKTDTGIIAGENSGTIENCFTTGIVISTSNHAGGIVGTNNGIIQNTISAAYISEASAYAGGIAGYNNGKISECASFTNSVSADMYAGGIAAMNDGTISNCLAGNMHVASNITASSGKITNNKNRGVTTSNYSYDKMDTVLADGYNDKNSTNGLSVSWETMKDPRFYADTLLWNMTKTWQMPKSDDSFLMPSLSMLPKPQLIEGLTIYAPKKITTEADLTHIADNTAFHYILTNDIRLTKPWITIAGDASLLENPENGFTGSIDGNGYTISNFTQVKNTKNKLYGLIGVNTGGSIKNLTLTQVAVKGEYYIGSICAVNYGYIENCTAEGKISANHPPALSAGGIAGSNYGHIVNTTSIVTLSVKANTSTLGGIAAYNEGFIDDCVFSGHILLTGTKERSNTTAGGIAGYSADGHIYNTYSDAVIETAADSSYAGGIVGMLDNGELYKTSARGTISTVPEAQETSYDYVGGITGLSNSGLIVHSFSASSLKSTAGTSYAGGIAGYNVSCNIQNTYSTAPIIQSGQYDLYAGGIAGVNENGFILSNIALNTSIRTYDTANRICGNSTGGMLDSNYALDTLMINYLTVTDSEVNGIGVKLSQLKNNDFFFKPVAEGGLLGWSSTKYEGEQGIWSSFIANNSFYYFPLLNGVKNQYLFQMPVYN